MSTNQPSPEGTETAEAVSNLTRLRSQLKPDGLAAALLSAWERETPTDAQARITQALTGFLSPKE